ncbi:MAG TPA: hypothetical protein VK196_09300 [Magnetospirillum sp.]|nr:hypothetical protein [Magnetospirillum sp.]
MSNTVARVNLTDAAKAFQVSVRTIQRKIEKGQIAETEVSRVG